MFCPRIFSLGFIKDERASVKQTFVNMANFMQIFLKSHEKSSTVNKGPPINILYQLWKRQLPILFSRELERHLILSCRRQTEHRWIIFHFLKYINNESNIYKYYMSFYVPNFTFLLHKLIIDKPYNAWEYMSTCFIFNWNFRIFRSLVCVLNKIRL